MSLEIKNLIELNKKKRQTYIEEKQSEAFQAALIKIQKYLKGYDPSKEELCIDIEESSSKKSEELCYKLVEHLKKQDIACTYKYQEGFSDGHDYEPSRHLIIFKF